MYRLMAGAHRYAIDYIEQAPVIVLAAAHGNAHVSWSERAFIQEQFRKMCESKAQLRDVMRSYKSLYRERKHGPIAAVAAITG